MKRLFKWLGISVLVVLLGAGALFVNVWYFKPVNIDLFYTRVFVRFGLRDPELLTSIGLFEQFGIRGHNARLADASPEADLELIEWWRGQYEVFKRYDRDDYDGQDLLSYDIFDYFAKSTLEGADRWRLYSLPVNQLFGVQSGVPDLLIQQHIIEDEKGAEHYIARLNAFETKFAQVTASLAERRDAGVHPPSFAVTKVIGQLDKFLAPAPSEHPLVTSFDERMAKIDASEISEARRGELRASVVEAVENVVYPTYKGLQSYLGDLSGVATNNHGVWHLPDGDAYYQFAIRENTTTDLTADEIHRYGLSEVARVGAQMNAILRDEGLSEGSIGERMRQIAQREDQIYPDSDAGRAQIIDDYQAIIDEIDPAMDEYFNLRPEVGVEVMRVPEFSEDTAPPAYYQPPSLGGSRPGAFFINLRNVKDNPRFAMRNLAYHEAIPGHHFQISIAQELEGLPIFRRLVPFVAYIEGWGLYSEQLAWEIGFTVDPLDNLGRLQAEMWRAVRLVVDTGMHAKRWTREEAIEYMLEHTGISEADVVVEIERYLVLPGQALGYKIGMRKILELRSNAIEALGDDFDLREFHDQVLGYGSLPLPILERVIDEWVASKQAGAEL
ncbi:MAG: DUF885 domain-containing protein [Pseudomonadota bacterium]